MPELVDVEITARNLRRWTRRAIIVDVDARDRRVVRPRSPGSLRHALLGRKVLGVSRRGKWIRVELDEGASLFTHLGMTGAWTRGDAAVGAHERVRLRLRRGRSMETVRYDDARRFGRVVVVHGDIPEWRDLGPDPLVDGLDVRGLEASLGKTRRALKVSLMDQTVLAGIGNVLATEALWRARLHPCVPSDRVTIANLKALARAIDTTLRREFTNRAEDAGRYRAYGRAGRPCARCGTKLVAIPVGGRTTVFCPTCQKSTA